MNNLISKNDIIKKYVNLNGIKPDSNDIININDTDNIIIMKFNNFYNKCYEFASGHQMDTIGFKKLNLEFMNTIYKELIENKDIENDIVIQHILYLISNSKIGSLYIYPTLIFNIIFKNIDINNNINISILNINGENILELNINNISCQNIYNLIYDKIKYKYDLYQKNQLKLLYNISILPNNNKLISLFITENNINLENIDI